jgi:hypothetical protein
MTVAPIPRLHGNRGDLIEEPIKVEHPRSAARGNGFPKTTGLFASPLHRFVRPFESSTSQTIHELAEKRILCLPISIARIARMLRLDSIVLVQDIAMGDQVVALGEEDILLRISHNDLNPKRQGISIVIAKTTERAAPIFFLLPAVSGAEQSYDRTKILVIDSNDQINVAFGDGTGQGSGSDVVDFRIGQHFAQTPERRLKRGAYFHRYVVNWR